MEGTRLAKVVVSSTLKLIAERLWADGECVTDEVLPARWVDLILYLEEKERRDASRPPMGDA